MKISLNTVVLYIGKPVFASVNWTVTDKLAELAKFFVNSCDLHSPDDGSLRLIDQNCYSEAFGLKQLQTDKVVSTTSNFRFTSFIVGQGSRSMKMVLKCQVKVCSVKEGKCTEGVTTTDANCPQTAGFQYKSNSYIGA